MRPREGVHQQDDVAVVPAPQLRAPRAGAGELQVLPEAQRPRQGSPDRLGRRVVQVGHLPRQPVQDRVPAQQGVCCLPGAGPGPQLAVRSHQQRYGHLERACGHAPAARHAVLHVGGHLIRHGVLRRRPQQQVPEEDRPSAARPGLQVRGWDGARRARRVAEPAPHAERRDVRGLAEELPDPPR